MKKRLVALLIALMMVLQLMPATVLSEGETVESTPVETVATVETPAASSPIKKVRIAKIAVSIPKVIKVSFMIF